MPILGPTTNHQEIRQWARANHAVPIELLPHGLDAEPALLRFMLAEQAKDHKDFAVVSWEEFFSKFDALGLSFVYDDETSGYNELLQIEEKSPYRQANYGAGN